MKGLSNLERNILECVSRKKSNFEEILYQTGIHENVCFNILQALMIRGLLKFENNHYRINDSISPLLMEEINGVEAKRSEALELIETVIDQDTEKVFKLQKIAMDSRDEKIFKAMLSNLETFLKDANLKAQSTVPLKERKVIFWGMGDVENIMKHIITGK